MTIKEARKNAGITQAVMSAVLGIPRRTIEDWESGKSNPSSWVVALVVEKLNNWNKPAFKINNSNVSNYAEVCKKFANDTKDWYHLDDYKFYTTDNSDWCETPDNAHDGINIAWAFHLTDEEIEMHAAEELLESLLNELNLAVDDEWDLKEIESLYNKYNF